MSSRILVVAEHDGSKLNVRERVFVAGIGPRGIVAAAVTSVFALRLAQENVAGADQLVPIMFSVIIGTVTIYGLGAAPLAARLELATPDRRGFVIVGADVFGRMIGKAIHDEGSQVLMVDTNRHNIQSARLAGLPVLYGSIAAEDVIEQPVHLSMQREEWIAIVVAKHRRNLIVGAAPRNQITDTHGYLLIAVLTALRWRRHPWPTP